MPPPAEVGRVVGVVVIRLMVGQGDEVLEPQLLRRGVRILESS